MKKMFGALACAGVLLLGGVSCRNKDLVGIAESRTNLSVGDQNFNKGWKFFRGDVEASQTQFDDSSWLNVALPHDWAISGPFSNKYNARTGGLPVTGTGWYRKAFSVDESMKGKQVSIEFDGAMCNAQVWVNGQFVGKRPFGYIGFEFDVTKYLKFGAENVVAVKLHQEDLSHRWYPGAGLYRNVRIKYNSPVHIPQWGTFITTPEVNAESAKVRVEVDVVNNIPDDSYALLATEIKDHNGNIIARGFKFLQLDPDSRLKSEQSIGLRKPRLWSLDDPYLYTADTTLLINGVVVDSYETEFGIRTVQVTPNNGVVLNGRRVQLKGVCMHHDSGPLGAAVNYRAKERQIEIMQSMGVNALRTSHNPPSPEMLQVCDRKGVLVIVEAFDEWQIGKVPNGYSKHFDEWHDRDLRDMIRRDRNHPSVIMWSIGNEILEQGRKDGWKVAKKLSDICKDEDSTRPTTVGFNYYPAPFDNKLAFQVDVIGFNYWPLNYKETKDKYPNMILYGSETSSQTSSRGVYHQPIEFKEKHETGQVTSYDAIIGPPWAYPPDVEFEQVEKNSFLLGEFMWTGFDYLGEPTPYGGRDNSTNGYWNDDWPSRSSYFGPVDLVGLPKDRFYLYQSQWTEKPMVHVLPHWNWKGMEGKSIPVVAYTNAEEVELIVNGKSYGRQKKGEKPMAIPAEFHFFEKGMYQSKYRIRWDVPYQAGAIKVVAYNEGEVVAEKEIKTAGEPARIVLSPDKKIIKADGVDLSYVTVSIVDKDGNVCPEADNLVSFSVGGAGDNVGVGNGDPRSLRSFKGDNMEAFSGKLMLIVQSDETIGEITIAATADGLKTSTLILKSEVVK